MEGLRGIRKVFIFVTRLLQDFTDGDDSDRASKKGGSGFFKSFREKLHKGSGP